MAVNPNRAPQFRTCLPATSRKCLALVKPQTVEGLLKTAREAQVDGEGAATSWSACPCETRPGEPPEVLLGAPCTPTPAWATGHSLTVGIVRLVTEPMPIVIVIGSAAGKETKHTQEEDENTGQTARL